jgi:hypothetical protein
LLQSHRVLLREKAARSGPKYVGGRIGEHRMRVFRFIHNTGSADAEILYKLADYFGMQLQLVEKDQKKIA